MNAETPFSAISSTRGRVNGRHGGTSATYTLPTGLPPIACTCTVTTTWVFADAVMRAERKIDTVSRTGIAACLPGTREIYMDVRVTTRHMARYHARRRCLSTPRPVRTSVQHPRFGIGERGRHRPRSGCRRTTSRRRSSTAERARRGGDGRVVRQPSRP